MTEIPQPPASTPEPTPQRRRNAAWLYIVLFVLSGIAAGVIAALLVSIFQRKQEAKNPYVRFVEVTEDTTDPAPWGVNWPREYDQYKRTSEPSHTNFGGGDAPAAAEKAERYPWLTRMFAGYAFSLDYRDRRGHAYMLLDQEKTRRVTERPQPGACLHCHASIMPTYRKMGNGDVQAGFVALSKMPYQAAHAEVAKVGSLNPVIVGEKQEMKHFDGIHPVSCVDCHDPKTMQIRVTRPGFINGIKALKKHQGVNDYDPNRDATRQEMRSYVCAQCHVEYYCGPKVTLFFPWNDGLKVEEMENYYDNYKFPDGHRFFDWNHAETGAELLKAQHPEFEMWNQGNHARSGVACADCHMPYMRAGAMKVSDHYVRSPLLNIANACQVCHHYSEQELKSRAEEIQNRNYALLQRAGQASAAFLDAFKPLRAPFDADPTNRTAAEKTAREKLAKDANYAKLPADQQAAKLQAETKSALNDMWAAHVQQTPDLKAITEIQRKAQWRLDIVAAENSMGFHAPQEAARILGESIDYWRQGQIAADNLRVTSKPAAQPTTRP